MASSLSELPRTLKLAMTDMLPIPLTFKYTFEKGELDEDRLRVAVETLLEGDFWPLRGVLHGLSIVVDRPFPEVFEVVERCDLCLCDVREDACLTDGLAYAALFDHCPVLKIRVTRLVDGHLIGVNISHSYADAHTFFRLFLPAVASQYSSLSFPHKIVNNRSLLSPLSSSPPTGQLGPHYLVVPATDQPMPCAREGQPMKTPGGTASVRVLLHLSSSSLLTLTDLTKSKTRLAAVYAVIWKALGVRHLIFPCNVRENDTRWSPRVPYGYAGNAVFVHGAICPNVADAPLSHLALLFQNAVAECTVTRNSELLSLMCDVVREQSETGVLFTVPMGDNGVAVTSWTHCELSPLFGDVRPQCVWSWAEYPRHLLSITDGEEEEGGGGEGKERGFDIHGHPQEIALIQSLLSSLLLTKV